MAILPVFAFQVAKHKIRQMKLSQLGIFKSDSMKLGWIH